MHLKVTLITLVALFGYCPAIHAENEPIKRIVFRTLTLEGSAGKIAYANNGKGSEAEHVVARSYRRSKFYTYEGNPNLIFYKQENPGDRIVTIEEAQHAKENGQQLTATPIAGSVNIADAPVAHGLIVLQQNQDGSINAFAMDESSDKFPEGTIRIVNITGEKLGAMINDQKVILPAGTMKLVDTTVQGLHVRIGLNRDGEVKAVLSRMFPFQKGQRALIVLQPGDDKGKTPKITVVKDNHLLVSNYLKRQ